MNLDAFTEHFSCLQEHRQPCKITYPLFDVLFGTLCAITAGAEGWSDIHEYISGHHNWFKNNGFFNNGVPVDDTIARIISRIKPEQFSQCFVNWMQSVHQLTQGELVAIDGKTLRSSYDRDERCSTIHMVSAFACANKLVLGQIKTDIKSNEIKAIPELIELLELKGALVSIDAMGCQKEIASSIIRHGGDYLLSVKGNQERLYKAVKAALHGSTTEKPVRESVTCEKGHGRAEVREYHLIDAKDIAAVFPEWEGLKSAGVAISYRQEKGKEATLEYRYYISSAELTREQFANAVRSHWAVETSLHWVLDMTMKEDDCQIYRENAAQNIAILRHIAVNMLREEKTKLSIRLKMKRIWMKTDYLEKVLQAGFSAVDKK